MLFCTLITTRSIPYTSRRSISTCPIELLAEAGLSPRQIFEAASSRLARELAAMEETDEPTALEKILEVLREHAPQYYENTEEG